MDNQDGNIPSRPARDPSEEKDEIKNLFEQALLSDLLSDNPEDCARAIFTEALVPSARTIVHLAAFAENEKLRGEMSKYVVERNLGKIVQAGEKDGIWEKLQKELFSE